MPIRAPVERPAHLKWSLWHVLVHPAWMPPLLAVQPCLTGSRPQTCTVACHGMEHVSSDICGDIPITAVVTCAGNTVARPAARPACSVAGRAIRRRSASHALAGGGRMGSWGHQKKGRPRRRWENPWVHAIGSGDDTLERIIDRLARKAGGTSANARVQGPVAQTGSPGWDLWRAFPHVGFSRQPLQASPFFLAVADGGRA